MKTVAIAAATLIVGVALGVVAGRHTAPMIEPAILGVDAANSFITRTGSAQMTVYVRGAQKPMVCRGMVVYADENTPFPTFACGWEEPKRIDPMVPASMRFNPYAR